ncbi:MAG: hypothetical protein KQH79_16625 [Bacteroidetes bacterium]|nr:hypothetical protein [Bacteroidota bacterium]
MTTKLIINSILFIAIIISGVWLAQLGKPYSTMAFNSHKFIALAFMVYTVVLSRGLIKTIEMSSIHWIFFVLSVFFILLILVSGGILSIKEEVLKPMILMHKLSSGLALISVIGWFYVSLK